MRKIEKIFEYLENQGIAVSDFERRSGLGNTYLKKTLERGSDLSLKIADRIRENNARDYYKIFPEEQSTDKVEPIPFLQLRREQKGADEPYMVPFVDIPAQAGYTQAYSQRDYIATLKKYPILPDVDPTGAIWRYFQVDGDSMEPEIMAGDTILCSQVNREDWTYNIRPKHTYVVVTDENLWIKDVEPYNDQEWILLSQNPEFEPFVVKVADIRQLWVMRRHIKARAKKHRMYDMDDILKKLGKA